jgi:hypothetical protein
MADPLSYFIPREQDDFSESQFATRGGMATPSVTPTEQPLEPTPELGDPLSYERDIQPMKKLFFRAAYNTGGRNAAALYDMNASRLDKSFNAEMQSRANEYGLYQKKMGLDVVNLQLQKAREEAERERNDAATIAPLVQELDALSSDPSLTQEQATMRHGQIGLKYGNVLATSKGAVASYNAVGNSIRALEPKPKEGIDITQAASAVAGTKGMAEITAYVEKNPDNKNRIPIDVFQRATDIASKDKAERAALVGGAEKVTMQMFKNLNDAVDAVGKAKLFEDPNTKKVDPTKFADPQSAAYVDSILNAYGSDELVGQLKTANAEARLRAAADIASGLRTGAIPFTPPPKKKAKPAGASWAE